jgi:hypothetical protein
MEKTKALVLFSGGLDSRLTIKLLQEQNLDVEAVYMKLPFGKGCCTSFGCVLNFTQIQGVKLYQIDASKGKLFKEYLKIIKNPKFKRGSAYNPCQDCKIFLFKQAKKLAKKINAQIIATGEVLGQRPMSQMKKYLLLDEKEAKLENKILRPLSAKLLPETIYEKKGLVNRNKFLDIQGRQRKQQIELAKKYKIKFPEPAGGCILCEKLLTNRFKTLIEKGITEKQANLIPIGRHFLINQNWIILGRNHKENLILQSIKTGKTIIPKTPGPTIKIFGKANKQTLDKLKKAYTKGTEIQRKEFEKWRI